jgi:hypothetical protein
MMDEKRFKEITNEIWKKANQSIILGIVGTFTLAGFILKYLFLKDK